MKLSIIIGIAICCFIATMQPCTSVRFTDWRNAWMWFENEVTEIGIGTKTFLSRVVLGPLLSATFKAAHMGYNFKDLLKDRLSEFILQQNHLIQEELSFFQEKAVENIADLYKLAMNSYNCTCEFYHCGCCGHAEENWLLELNATGCFRISYLVEDYGFGLGITLNGRTICNETVSARDPPSLCLGLPYITHLPRLCARLHQTTSSGGFHTCVRIEAKVKKVVVAKYEFGCFKIETTMFPSVSKLDEMFNHVLENPTVLMI
ncbi:uncharacterized protein [Anabrus simplex]|uniref:uncharacterized protein n=1 Tax=Anabrus simplex TaxID=316456 RepID=UPI0035A2BAE0